MTEPERAALDHIRQVVDSVIGVTAPPEPLSSGMQPSILPVPYFPQAGDEAGPSTIDSGAAAGVMLVRAYGNESITPADFYNQTGPGADNPLSFTQIMNALGVNAVAVELRSNLKLADLSLILFSGRPVIAPIKQAVLQQAGLTPVAFDGAYYVVVVGMDVKQVYIHDPGRQDTSGQAKGVSWLTFYQAWTQAEGYERAVLVPHQQLVRRVRITADVLDVYGQPGGADAISVGKVSLGELFEVTKPKSGWGKIGDDRWINLSSTADI
jgi:hypothetical protein